LSRIAQAALAVTLAAIAVFGAIASQGVTPSQLPSAMAPVESPHQRDVAPPPHGALTEQMIRDAEEDFLVDLYGNEVTPAVATYTFDDLGTLYEVHSPQTEVPRLGSPKS
jgi:hypothetical protein